MIRRLHRIVSATPNVDETMSGEDSDKGTRTEENEFESQMARLDLLKWRVGLQRMLASFKTMERQKGVYEAKVRDTGESGWCGSLGSR